MTGWVKLRRGHWARYGEDGRRVADVSRPDGAWVITVWTSAGQVESLEPDGGTPEDMRAEADALLEALEMEERMLAGAA